ncbi:nuclear transport factor 2-like [Tasmannia lanceolata]|uniref:nuclear transport factor 2-like n=1 Tax=Tasmannia lanceolata TaxID=3420 RepID=UPI004063AC2F
MALPTVSPAPAPPSPALGAQLVGDTFVEQYYHILHESPELVYRFYQDSSVLSRPEPSGVMTSVTTMQAINEKILSVDHKNFKSEIKSADAQDSYKGGVIVLVTGCLTGTDNVRRKFSQSFFLAPQDKGYFVFNDVFRYMDETESTNTDFLLVNGSIESAPIAPLTPDLAPDHHVSDPATSISEEDLNNDEEACEPSDNGEGLVVEEEVVVDTPAHSSQNEVRPHAELTSSSQNEVGPLAESTSSLVQEDAPKKSYASIVKGMKENKASATVHVPTTTFRVAPVNTERRSLVSASPAPVPETRAPSSNNLPDEAESHSIYIRGLPLDATVAELEEEFKKFGPIKPFGVQVRKLKPQGFCFGFVEFESSSSMHSAIEASSVTIGGRQAFIEEKKTTSRVGGGSGSGGRGRFPPRRGNFRNESLRDRGNFGGRSFGRSDYGVRGEFSGRGQGGQNGNGRATHSSGVNQTAVSA